MNLSLFESLQRLRLDNPFSRLDEPVLILAFLFCVVGFIFNVLGDKQDPLRAFVRLAVASVFIASKPLWTAWVRDGLYFLPYSILDYHASLIGVFRNIATTVNAALDQKALDFTILEAFGSVMMDFTVALFMRTIAGVGSLVAVPLLFVQVGVEGFLATLLPVAIAALTVPAIRNQAQGFIAFWVSVLIWPLFFAVVTVIAGSVFTVSNHLNTSWTETLVTGGIVSNLIAPFAAGAILIGGVLATPPLTYSICAHGGAALTGPSPSLITFLR